MTSNQHVWIVILAAGEGKRVLDLTYDRWGKTAPKQYSTLDGTTTLLETTLERAKKISPPERIVAIVAEEHESWWASELAEIPRENVIVQPENRGTAAGILLPLLWITRRDPDALLVVLPSDHGVTREETLRSAIADAVSSAAHSEAGLVLLGVRPESPESDYGWIVPGPGADHNLRPVAAFREKPDSATATDLFNQGAFLNSFILIASGRFLLDLFKTALPHLWDSFQPISNGRWDSALIKQEIVKIYRSIPIFDFSKELLERAAEHLWVYPVPPCGWLDLGTPERLLSHLSEHSQPAWTPQTLPTAPPSSQGTRRASEPCRTIHETFEITTRPPTFGGA